MAEGWEQVLRQKQQPDPGRLAQQQQQPQQPPPPQQQRYPPQHYNVGSTPIAPAAQAHRPYQPSQAHTGAPQSQHHIGAARPVQPLHAAPGPQAQQYSHARATGQPLPHPSGAGLAAEAATRVQASNVMTGAPAVGGAPPHPSVHTQHHGSVARTAQPSMTQGMQGYASQGHMATAGVKRPAQDGAGYPPSKVQAFGGVGVGTAYGQGAAGASGDILEEEVKRVYRQAALRSQDRVQRGERALDPTRLPDEWAMKLIRKATEMRLTTIVEALVQIAKVRTEKGRYEAAKAGKYTVKQTLMPSTLLTQAETEAQQEAGGGMAVSQGALANQAALHALNAGPKVGADSGKGTRKIELRDVLVYLERDSTLRKSPVLYKAYLRGHDDHGKKLSHQSARRRVESIAKTAEQAAKFRAPLVAQSPGMRPAATPTSASSDRSVPTSI